jgi:DNA-binding transcriptional LysR family regulator
VRIGALQASDSMIAKPLAPYAMVLCASPGYLARRGIPSTVAELSDHDGLNHLLWTNATNWRALKDSDLIDFGRFGTPLSSNNGCVLRVAALKGTGIAMLPRVLLEGDIRAGRLVPLLEDHLPPARPVHLIYPYDSKPLPKLTHLVKFLVNRLGAPH